MSSTVERIVRVEHAPMAARRYLDELVLSPQLEPQRTQTGVCWPEFGGLDWRASGLAIAMRPTSGDDRLGFTGAFCIAQTRT